MPLFHKESEADRAWGRRFLELKPQFDTVVDSVDHVIRFGNTPTKISILQKAATDLPSLVSRLETLPSPESAKLVQRARSFADGMALYAHGCSRMVAYYQTGDESIGVEAASYVEAAKKLMNAAGRW